MKRRLQLYLVHVENQDGRLWHYVGVTRLPNIRDRLRRHMWGDTKSFDHIAAKTARDIAIWKLYTDAHFGLEKTIAMQDESFLQAHVCPRCRSRMIVRQKNGPARLFDERDQEEITLS